MKRPCPAELLDEDRDPFKSVTVEDGYVLGHGAVVIAAITSCTNTSNPQVLMAAGLLARNAVQRGIGVKWTTGEITRQPRLYDTLGIDEAAETIVGYFWYGRPAVVAPQQRRAVGEIVVTLA